METSGAIRASERASKRYVMSWWLHMEARKMKRENEAECLARIAGDAVHE